MNWKAEYVEPFELRIMENGHAIAEVYLDDAPVPDYNAEQDQKARLMAGAPRMVEALVNCLVTIDHLSRGRSYRVRDMRNRNDAEKLLKELLGLSRAMEVEA